jgi:hypothetical protein
VNLIDILQLIHFGKGKAKVFQSGNKFKALNILVRINPLSSLNPPDRVEKTDLFIVANRTGAHTDQIGQLSDLIVF